MSPLVHAAIVIVGALVPTLGCAGASACTVEHRSARGTEVSTLTRQGRLVRVSFDDQRGGHGRTRFSYDRHGRLRSTQYRFSTRGFRQPHPGPRDTTPRRSVVRTHYRHDGAGRPSAISRTTNRWSSSSATGRPDQRGPRGGELLEVTRDANLVRMHHRANGETTEYTYRFVDGALASAVVTASAGPATWRYGHDDAGRLASVEEPVEVCFPGSPCHANRCRFTHERGGRLRTYVCDAGHPGRYEVDQAGRLVSATRDVETTYRYDEQGRLVAIESSSEAGGMERLTYRGHCPARLVQRFAPGVDPMALVDQPPRPELWPADTPVR